jgi:hypothetical protein
MSQETEHPGHMFRVLFSFCIGPHRNLHLAERSSRGNSDSQKLARCLPSVLIGLVEFPVCAHDLLVVRREHASWIRKAGIAE